MMCYSYLRKYVTLLCIFKKCRKWLIGAHTFKKGKQDSQHNYKAINLTWANCQLNPVSVYQLKSKCWNIITASDDDFTESRSYWLKLISLFDEVTIF